MDEVHQIAQARHRDETAASALGEFTPVAKLLDQANLREDLFWRMADFVAAVASDTDGALAAQHRQVARQLMEKVRAL